MAHPIHIAYRIAFNYLEPFSASAGALQVALTPLDYLKIASPHAAVHFVPELRPLMTAMIGGWLIIAFDGAVTLRSFSRNVMLWRCIITAHLLSDILYGISIWQDIGLERMVNPVLWDGNDWLMAVGTWPLLFLKIAFLLGIGVDSSKSKTN